MKSFLKFFLLSSLVGASLVACSGGGDKDEMPALSDKELLERGNAGHNPTGGPAGKEGPPANIPQGGPQRPGGR